VQGCSLNEWVKVQHQRYKYVSCMWDTCVVYEFILVFGPNPTTGTLGPRFLCGFVAAPAATSALSISLRTPFSLAGLLAFT
jgi:hypothetical protein